MSFKHVIWGCWSWYFGIGCKYITNTKKSSCLCANFGGVEVGISELVANISRTHKVKLFVCKFWEFKRLVIHHKHGQFWHFLMKWAKNKYLQHNMQNNNSWIQKFTTIVVRSTLDHQNLWFPASWISSKN